VFDVCWMLDVVLYALEMLEGMRRVLLCILEAVEGELCLVEVVDVLEVVEVMLRVRFCMLEAVEGALCLLEVLEVPEKPEVMRFCLYAGGCGRWALFAGGNRGDSLYATLYAGGCGGFRNLLEVMRCMLLCIAGGC